MVVVVSLSAILGITVYGMILDWQTVKYAKLDLSAIWDGDERFVTSMATFSNENLQESFSILSSRSQYYLSEKLYVVNGTYEIQRTGLWGTEISNVTLLKSWVVTENQTGELVIRVPFQAFKDGLFLAHYKGANENV